LLGAVSGQGIGCGPVSLHKGRGSLSEEAPEE
jgi:hypothetical protein